MMYIFLFGQASGNFFGYFERQAKRPRHISSHVTLIHYDWWARIALRRWPVTWFAVSAIVIHFYVHAKRHCFHRDKGSMVYFALYKKSRGKNPFRKKETKKSSRLRTECIRTAFRSKLSSDRQILFDALLRALVFPVFLCTRYLFPLSYAQSSLATKVL